MPTAQNSLHPIDIDTDRVFADYRSRSMRGGSHATSLLFRRSKEERAVHGRILEQTMKALQIDTTSERAQLKELEEARLGAFADAVKDRYSREKIWAELSVPPPAPPPPTPAPTDHTFWWARTEWTPSVYKWAEYEISAGMHGGTVVIYGWVSERNGDLRQGSFGARALFELQRHRVPDSRSQRWISTPTVDIGGTISGVAPSFSIWTPAQGEHWAKCAMTCTQRVYQHGLGGPLELGKREAKITLFDHEDGGSTDYLLPGFHAMPALEFPIPAVAESLWAELDVRFDYQVEGSGSSVSFANNPVTLLFKQWPLQPSA